MDHVKAIEDAAKRWAEAALLDERTAFEAWAIREGYAERAALGLWWRNGVSEMDLWAAWQARAPRGQATAGWAIVPADATDSMMAAFAKAAAAKVDWHGATEVERQEVRDGFGPAYRAMLAAAPQSSPTPQADSQPAPNACDGKDPRGCWNVRCQLGKRCINSDRAARAPADSVTAPAGGVEDDVDAIALAHIDCGEAGCAEGCCGNAKCLPSAAPAQQPWQYAPPAQERIDALELEVRQLTEQAAALRHAIRFQQPAPSAAPSRVYLVATGEIHEGEETYTRHDNAPPPLCDSECLYTAPQAADSVLEDAARQPQLKVRLTAFPESNGKQNWTALLVRSEPWGGLVGNCGGISLARGELWNRVAYEAECARFLIGERDTEPCILDYAKDIKTPDEWAGEREGGRMPLRAARKQGGA